MKRILLFLSLFCVTTSVFANSNDLFNDGVALYSELKETIDNREQQDYIEGDANGDGEVNIADIQTTASYILALSDQIEFDNADRNNDGTIDVRDIKITINDICFYPHEYVDLGLTSGLKWATCNVGAENPEDYGDYFAWGEIAPKDDYSYEEYQLQFEGDDLSGNPQYDAATANWGSDWRMPTQAEVAELIRECEWEGATVNGVAGMKVTSNKNGNHIFFPSAGCRNGESLQNASSRGQYWTSTYGFSYDGVHCAVLIDFTHQSGGYSTNYCHLGRSVRPVSLSIDAPKVTTNAVINITETTAECGGNVYSEGLAAVTSRGVCWSTSPNPKIHDAHTIDGSGIGEFTSNITGLKQGVTYYLRAYATNTIGTGYGEEVSFTTEGEFVPEYVDLGLPSGLKWAIYNVGAYSPDEYGNHYAWGEIAPKDEYTEDGYLAKDVDIDISGNAEYDAATANWGEEWRMPTSAECKELIDNCTWWEWTSRNGVYGCMLTGPNGNYIFFPAAGSYNGSLHYADGEFGFYWSSTPKSDILAENLFFRSDNRFVFDDNRYYGMIVRPVTSGLTEETLPKVTTERVRYSGLDRAECEGYVMNDGGADVTARGVCWSTSQNPTIEDAHIISGSGAGRFVCHITGLKANTTYYVRTYATNSEGTSYGEEVSFTTEDYEDYKK